jgi:hypothetical protein
MDNHSYYLNGVLRRDIPTWLKGVCISLSLLVLVGSCSRGCAYLNIQDYYALKETIPEIRKQGNQFENLSLKEDIIENNKCLRTYKYLNKMWLLDPVIPDEMDSLKPIY